MPFCLLCDNELKGEDELFKDDDVPDKKDFSSWNPLYGGLTFRSRGNYGSTLYDPLNSDEYLEVYLCDECTKKRSARVQRIIVALRRESLSDSIRSWEDRRAKYDKFNEFLAKVEPGEFGGEKACSPDRMTHHESRVLWALQGLPNKIIYYDKGQAGLSFMIPDLGKGIGVVGEFKDFIRSDKSNVPPSDEEVVNFVHKASSNFPGVDVLAVRLTDMYLRNKKLGLIYNLLPKQLRDKVVDFIGAEAYETLPEPEPGWED